MAATERRHSLGGSLRRASSWLTRHRSLDALAMTMPGMTPRVPDGDVGSARPVEPPQPTPKSCSICCDPDSQPVVLNCGECGSDYCVACMLHMFREALEDRSEMPPACCRMMPLHLALPHLTADEAAHFRQLFGEVVLVGDGFHCPNPRCSVFISGARVDEAVGSCGERLATSKGKERAQRDSVMSNGEVPACVACDKCGMSACTVCHNLAHPGRGCADQSVQEQGLKEQLKAWGYKQCPRCGNGFRRMFGCNRVQCGWCCEQFCWGCLQTYNDCAENGCVVLGEDDDDDDFTDDESVAENDRDGPAAPEPVSPPHIVQVEDELVEQVGDEQDGPQRRFRDRLGSLVLRYARILYDLRAMSPAQSVLRDSDAPGSRHLNSTLLELPPFDPTFEIAAPVSAQPVSPPRESYRDNLDGRSRGHWAQSGLDFGVDPGDRRCSPMSCRHQWEGVEAQWARTDAAAQMECHRCWRIVVVTMSELSASAKEGHQARGMGPRLAKCCKLCGFLSCEQCASSLRKKKEQD